MHSDSDNESHDKRSFNDEREFSNRPKSRSSVDWHCEGGSILGVDLDKDKVRQRMSTHSATEMKQGSCVTKAALHHQQDDR